MVSLKKKSARRPTASAQRRAPSRRHYRQAFVGNTALGYPFRPESVTTRDADRQRKVEEYAKMALPQGTYEVLKKRGCRWLPSDADLIRTHTVSAGRKIAQEFVAGMYVLDLAHATTKMLNEEIDYIVSQGRADPAALARIAGIVANVTGARFDAGPARDENAPINNADEEARIGRLLEAVRRILAGGNGVAIAANASDFYMFPVDIAANGVEAPCARDTYLNGLLTDLEIGHYNAKNFSLLAVSKVFAPLGTAKLTNVNASASARTGEEQKEIGHSYSVDSVFRGDAGNVQIDASDIEFPLKDTYLSGNRNAIQLELRELTSKATAIARKCGDALRAFRTIGRTVRVPGKATDGDFYFYPDCPAGHVPVFMDANNVPVPAVLTDASNGEYYAPTAVMSRCVRDGAMSSRMVVPRVTTAAAQRRASSARKPAAQKAISLRQVEAMPKRDLAKFVQVCLNMN